ncbi:choline dehydrogenase [Dokdonella sp.]|uniref:GMC family oxidoreductase n=1 Tax=Dokdonella sp. TaxID=2291710 RepID=UPI001AFDA332|nr:choline dehydrogenase [Dokdonella sp.]MBO9664776.1 choline dehydrogenase [Dokdonella sp.]
MVSSYDFVIVGAGSAGCVLANRLSANPANRVLLLEAGGRDWHPFIHMPAGLGKLFALKRINWDYSTEPEPALRQRRLWWPRGRVLGGSSSINAMCYARGVGADYDEWAEATGDPRWAWSNVLEVFKRGEDNARGADAWHGVGGPLTVSDLRHHNVLSQTFVDAAAAAGIPRNDDFNGATQEGVGFYQVTQRDGARCSAAVAYLKPARARENLTVLTQAQATRVRFDGTRAAGVEYRRGGRSERVEAGQVLLAGGAINSPQLLMLSGVGPADHLREHGIGVVLDAREVGANLQDHLDICTLVQSTRKITYDTVSDTAVALEFLLRRRGIGTSNIAEAGGFVRTRYATDARCDVQFHFVPALLDDHGRNKLPGSGYTVHACFLRPRSRGSIRLKSADPSVAAEIRANYLGDAEGFDLKVMVEAARLAREILAQAPFAPYRGAEIFPGAAAQSEAELADFVRRKAETIYHPVGTCRMGRDAAAVLDGELRVRGVDNLRVVDASVMPNLVSGNTNAPTMMIAERAAELLLDD